MDVIIWLDDMVKITLDDNIDVIIWLDDNMDVIIWLDDMIKIWLDENIDVIIWLDDNVIIWMITFIIIENVTHSSCLVFTVRTLPVTVKRNTPAKGRKPDQRPEKRRWPLYKIQYKLILYFCGDFPWGRHVTDFKKIFLEGKSLILAWFRQVSAPRF